MVIRRINASPYRAQKGVVAIFATLAMVVLIGAGALALDVGNLILSKGKLQNLVDSAALSAAKAIASGGDQAAAILAGNEAINNNLILDGFGSMTIDGTDIHYEFSESLPFDSSTSTTTSPYVRVRIEDVDVADYLVIIFNIDMSARSSAVAGPSSSLGGTCNIVPLSVCQGPDTGEDGSNISGYEQGSLHVLKASLQNDSSIGAGNFMPMALYDADGNLNKGADAYKKALAGDYDACLDFSNETITSEPGNKVGPSLAIDSRFFEDKIGNKTYYPDTHPEYDKANPLQVITETDDSGVASYQTTQAPLDSGSYFEQYMNRYKNQSYDACLDGSCGRYFRRILTVPIIDCDAIPKPGRTAVPFKGFACFFLVQPVSATNHVDKSNGQGNGSWIVGEFIKNCRNNTGEPGMAPNDKGPYKIVLFNDPDSEDS